jgi:hypothetical protein
VDPQQLDKLGRVAERIRDHGAIGKRQRCAQLAIDLGEQRRTAWYLLGAVECGEPCERRVVVGERGANRDL